MSLIEAAKALVEACEPLERKAEGYAWDRQNFNYDTPVRADLLTYAQLALIADCAEALRLALTEAPALPSADDLMRRQIQHGNAEAAEAARRRGLTLDPRIAEARAVPPKPEVEG